MLSFHGMENKWGAAAAYHLLTEMEKAAGISSFMMTAVDPEVRLANALRIQDALSAPLAFAA